MGCYHFDNTGGGEQEYSVIGATDEKELLEMVRYAGERGIKLVAVMDAECDVVMITTQRIANLLIPILDSEQQPLDALNRTEG